MAELAALNVKITGDASGIKAAANSATKSVESFTKSAESSAKVFERAFAQNERSVDRLRRAIDPVYASSKKYESAVNTLDKALKQGTITQAAHARMLEQAGAAYLRAGSQAGTATAAMGRFGAMSALNRSRVQNLGFQLQDMAIQFQAGTRASVVFAQQGSQIASIFGPVGAIIGTLAAVGIPLLAFAFANGAEEGKKLEDVMSDLRDLSSGLKDAQDILAMSVDELSDKYGRYALAVQEAARQLAFLQAAEARARLAESLQDMNEALRDFVQTEQTAFRSGTMLTTAIGNLSRELDITRPQARELSEALRDVRDAGSFDEMVAALQVVGTLLEEAGVSGDKIPPPLRQALIDVNNLTIGAAEMAARFEDAADAAASISFGSSGPPRRGGKRGQSEGSNAGRRGSIRSGGGGAAPANPLVSQLESLRQSLMTQEEAQIASYQRQQETLQKALEQRLITQQEYQALMEDAQQQHSDRMAQIDAYRYGDTLQKAGAFFGDMAGAFQSGNEKMAAIGKKFAAIEALINAWRAYSQTLADPRLPFWQKVPAALSILGAGMKAVKAIGGSGGAGGATAAPAAASGGAAASNSTYFNVSLTGGNNFGGEQIRGLISQINQAIEDGAVIRGLRVT